MKYYYRIVQLNRELFQVQFREWWCPIWSCQNHHGTLHSAKRCVDYQRTNDGKLPKVINY